MHKITIIFIFLFSISFSLIVFAQDFGSPVSTVQTYQDSYLQADKVIVEQSFDPPAAGFYIPKDPSLRNQPCAIQKATRYPISKVKKWNKEKIQPPLKDGDFEVVQVCRINDKSEKFFFYLRKFNK